MTYDDWKLATPPEYEEEGNDRCEECGEPASDCICDGEEEDDDEPR